MQPLLLELFVRLPGLLGIAHLALNTSARVLQLIQEIDGDSDAVLDFVLPIGRLQKKFQVDYESSNPVVAIINTLKVLFENTTKINLLLRIRGQDDSHRNQAMFRLLWKKFKKRILVLRAFLVLTVPNDFCTDDIVRIYF